MNRQRLSLFGLKFHPFRPSVPLEALMPLPTVEALGRSGEFSMGDGGFVMLTGDPGTRALDAVHAHERSRRKPSSTLAGAILPLLRALDSLLGHYQLARNDELRTLDDDAAAADDDNLSFSPNRDGRVGLRIPTRPSRSVLRRLSICVRTHRQAFPQGCREAEILRGRFGEPFPKLQSPTDHSDCEAIVTEQSIGAIWKANSVEAPGIEGERRGGQVVGIVGFPGGVI